MDAAPLRLLFLGNGPFACPALERLSAGRHQVLAVIARPDRPQGKKQEIVPGPTASTAARLGLPLLQPDDVNTADALRTLAGFAADLLVVADFGQ
ncbi:MAG: methionyl-tRNA formyltransferase, partial [Planctomycetia bacterium]